MGKTDWNVERTSLSVKPLCAEQGRGKEVHAEAQRRRGAEGNKYSVTGSVMLPELRKTPRSLIIILLLNARVRNWLFRPLWKRMPAPR